MAIISLSDQMSIRPVSFNWARYTSDNGAMNNFTVALQDVEQIHLKKLLGRAFYKDIDDNPLNYATVLNGGAYTTTSGDTVPFEGLKYITAYLVAARYVQTGYKQSTYSGMLQQKQADSEGLSAAQRKEEQVILEGIALDEWGELKNYLDINKDSYALWDCTNKVRTTRPTLSGVRRTFLK